MKMKLIAIVILALLLCAMVPMATAAAPGKIVASNNKKDTFVHPVLMLDTGSHKLLGQVGYIAYNERTGDYAAVVFTLQPGIYRLGITTDMTNRRVIDLRMVSVGNNGMAIVHGQEAPDIVTQCFAKSGQFVVYQ